MKETIKFKGKELEQVSEKEYLENLGIVYGCLWIGARTYYLIQKSGKKTKGQVVKK